MGPKSNEKKAEGDLRFETQTQREGVHVNTEAEVGGLE